MILYMCACLNVWFLQYSTFPRFPPPTSLLAIIQRNVSRPYLLSCVRWALTFYFLLGFMSRCSSTFAANTACARFPPATHNTHFRAPTPLSSHPSLWLLSAQLLISLVMFLFICLFIFTYLENYSFFSFLFSFPSFFTLYFSFYF